MTTLTVPQHHARRPYRCNRCRARVYRYSDELLASRLPTGRHFCSVCTRAVAGEDLTRYGPARDEGGGSPCRV